MKENQDGEDGTLAETLASVVVTPADFKATINSGRRAPALLIDEMNRTAEEFESLFRFRGRVPIQDFLNWTNTSFFTKRRLKYAENGVPL